MEFNIEKIVENVIYILGNLSLGLIGSFIFWYISFVLTGTDIVFCKYIEKSINKNDHYKGKYRYRIKLFNKGKRDLIDVAYVVRLRIRNKGFTEILRLQLGPGSSPVISGLRTRFKSKGKIGKSSAMKINFTDVNYITFENAFFPDSIRKKAIDRTLAIEDVLSEYKDNYQIIVYVTGNDAITGTRKMFSKTYTNENVRFGEFKRFKISEEEAEFTNPEIRDYQNKALDFVEEDTSSI